MSCIHYHEFLLTDANQYRIHSLGEGQCARYRMSFCMAFILIIRLLDFSLFYGAWGEEYERVLQHLKYHGTFKPKLRGKAVAQHPFQRPPWFHSSELEEAWNGYKAKSCTELSCTDGLQIITVPLYLLITSVYLTSKRKYKFKTFMSYTVLHF